MEKLLATKVAITNNNSLKNNVLMITLYKNVNHQTNKKTKMVNCVAAEVAKNDSFSLCKI